MVANREVRPNAYDLLGVHPNAPSELIATSYWFLVGDLQKRREQGEYVDDALHEFTRAYERISDPRRRSRYDEDIGHTQEPLTKRKLPRVHRSLRSRLFRRATPVGSLDHYEVLGISFAAPSEILPAAYRIMRDQYFRVPARSKKRLQLLKALDDAYATLSAPERRQKYEEHTRKRAPAESPVVSPGLEGTVQSDPPESGNGMKPRGITTPPAAATPLDRVTPVNGPAAARATKKISGAGKWIGAAPRALGQVLAAGARLLYRGLSRGAGRAAEAWRGRRTRRVPDAGATETQPLQRQPILREPPPRPKIPSVDVEEALLGRLEESVRETRSRPGAAKHKQSARHDR